MPQVFNLFGGKTLAVDSEYGSAFSAVRALLNRPFLTIGAAKAAALSGDRVETRPGAYTVTESIAKAGVHWSFVPGTSILRSDTAGDGVIDDGNTSMNFVVDGAADFTRESTDFSSPRYVVRQRHASSNTSIRCRSVNVLQSASGSQLNGVVGYNGKLRVEADYIGTEDSVSANGGSMVWWENGEMYVRANRIAHLAGQAIYGACNATPSGEFYVEAGEIAGKIPIYVDSSNSTAGTWIRSLIVRQTVSGSGARAVDIGTANRGRLYIDTEKIFGLVHARVSGIATSGGLNYVWTQKWSAVGNGTNSVPGLLKVEADSIAFIQIEAMDVSPEAFTGNMIVVDGGTVEIRGMRYVGNAGSLGVEVTGGVLRLINCEIDTSANSSTNPIIKSGGTLELVNCTLVAHSTRNAIEAGTSQVVLVEGVLAINRPLDADVTATGGLVVRTDTGVATFPAAPAAPHGTDSERWGAGASAPGANSLAVGAGANTPSGTAGNTAVGRNATVTSSGTAGNAVAIGFGASAYGHNSFAMGQGSSTTNENGVALGALSTAALQAVACGCQAAASGTQSLAAGELSSATATRAVAVGYQAQAAQQQSISIGYFAFADAAGDITFARRNHPTSMVRFQTFTDAADRNQAGFSLAWATTTDASRAGRIEMGAWSVSTFQPGVRVEGNSGGVRLGFFGGTAVAKPTVTGSRGGNAALASLLTELANLGLITDSTS